MLRTIKTRKNSPCDPSKAIAAKVGECTIEIDDAMKKFPISR